VHWARLETSALGGLIAACPAWKRREKKRQHAQSKDVELDMSGEQHSVGSSGF